MTPLNVLTQLLRSTFSSPDPGDGNTFHLDGMFKYLALKAASATSGAETRTLAAPAKAGLECKIGCSYYGNGAITVTVVLIVLTQVG